MSNRGKRYDKARALVDRARDYTLDEAIKLVKEGSTVKFDATVELHAHLGIDTKKAEQIVRASVTLPHSTGAQRTIAVFVPTAKEAEAKKAGADVVGGDELLADIVKTGKTNFDIAVTTPDFMKNMAKVARILGPKGLMPNPRNETITTDLAKTIGELKKGKLTFRADAGGNVHVALGKVSMPEAELKANTEAFLDALKKARPQDMKGTYLRSVTLTSAMGPGIRMKI